MNITTKKIDDVNIQITITVTKNDYQYLVNKSLCNLRKSAIVPGFRMGNVPLLIIKSMYKESVLTDEVNRLVLNRLSEYIKENKLNIFGKPYLIKSNLDLCNQKEYEFLFDVWLTPQVDISLTKCDELPYYSIYVTNTMMENHINFIMMKYGRYDTRVEIIETNDIIKGKFIELNKYDIPQKEGINVINVTLSLFHMKDEVEKLKFIGKKVGDIVVFDPYKAFKKNKIKLSFFLKIWKMRITKYQGNFSFVITEINRYKCVELDQELFNRVYGVGVVNSKKVFKKKIEENLLEQLQFESDCRFLCDAKQFLLKKMDHIKFPENFFKKYLIKSNFKNSKEIVEKNFFCILQDVKIQFICNKILEENGVIVTLEDIRQSAKDLAKLQLASSNLYLISNTMLEKCANEILKIKKNIEQLYNKALETKIISVLKKKITLKFLNVTEEEFLEIP